MMYQRLRGFAQDLILAAQILNLTPTATQCDPYQPVKPAKGYARTCRLQVGHGAGQPVTA
jgi:hypothetical protein